MDIHINAISEEQFTELLDTVRANHAETTATLAALGAAMASNAAILREVAAGLRGPLATSILDLISERDAAERARVEAVNALAAERGEEAVEEAEESTAAKDPRDAFGEVAGLFDDPKLPDVEPLPELPADVDPVVDEPEPNTDPEPAAPADEAPVVEEPTDEVSEEPVPEVEEPASEVPADEETPAVEEPVPAPEAPADEVPADEAPVEPTPAEQPVDDGSGAIVPDDVAPADTDEGTVPASEAGASVDEPAPNPGAESDAASEDGAAESPDEVPNPGAEQQ